MAQSVFGTGNLWGIPAGAVASTTPVRFGTLQDVSWDTNFDLKKLYGGFQFPVEQGRGKGTIDLKATIGRVDPVLFNQMFFGLTNPTGELLGSVDEVGVIPTTPFQITVVNSATWSKDLGVYNTTTGLWMSRVASAPATGQYTVAAGVYTFVTGNAGASVRISYTYTAVTGNTITQTNTLMGASPIFGVTLTNAFRGKTLTANFLAVQSSKLHMPLKLDDFMLSGFDMSAQDDGTGNVFTLTMTG